MMDVDVLVELIECSVCLERMDNKSKVLPCQHTFCSDCLTRIGNSSKKQELKCPECRSVCTASVKDLPANILLVRLLEGLKAAGKTVPTKDEVLFTAGKPCAKAVYSYESQESGDLSFKRGAIINLKKKLDENWYIGEWMGKTGYLPATYIQVICPLPEPRSQSSAASSADNEQQSKSVKTSSSANQLMISATALYDFEMKDEEKEDCLKFKKDDIIQVIRRVDQNWAEGKLAGAIGIFPLSYVQLSESAQLLLNNQNQKISSNQSSPNITSDNTASASNITTTQEKSITMNIPLGNTQQKKDEICCALNTAQDQDNTSSAHNSTGESDYQNITPANSNQLSAAVSSAPSSPLVNQLPAFSMTSADASARPNVYKALYNYKPQKDDELGLERGAFYNVLDKCKDGWHRGSCLLTGAIGVFPGNYVQQVTSETVTLSAASQKGRKGIAPPSNHKPGPSGDNSQKKSNSSKANGAAVRESQREESKKFWGMDLGSVNNPATTKPRKSDAIKTRHNSQSENPTQSNQPISEEGEVPSEQKEHTTLPVRYRCIAPYPPAADNELDLRVGDIIYVSKRKMEGWYRGTNATTGKTGLFPESFVQAYPVRKE